MTSKMADLKAAGQPLPTSIEEVEQKLGECAALVAASKYTAIGLPTLLLSGGAAKQLATLLQVHGKTLRREGKLKANLRGRLRAVRNAACRREYLLSSPLFWT